MPVSHGDRLGPYEIISPVGAGSMGTVWKARDTRLDRTVAIKVANGDFSERFEREARAVAALNHPNVCQLYDVGPHYLVMEFVEGSPVAPGETSRKLLDIATQIADGMASAHAAGIVHRDLKPDNILLTNPRADNPGRVKILDFGLARRSPVSQAQGVSARSAEATRSIAITDPGSTVGTIAYMSPEQARGDQNLTAQSDQFSFGLLLYEMAAGKRAFVRKSAAEIMTAIIREDAEPLPATVPAALRWIIERLLSKDPSERYDSTRDLYRELRQLRDKLSDASAGAIDAIVPASAKRKRVLGLVGVCAVLVAATATAIWTQGTFARAPEDRPFARFSVDLGPEARDEPRLNLAISPDGTRIAFRSNNANGSQISVLSLNQAKAAPVPGTEGGDGPFFSPDGQWLGFVASGKLKKVLLQGGSPITLCEVPSALPGASWGQDGSIVGTMGSQTEPGTQTGLSRVPDSGGAPQPLTRPSNGEATHRWPQFFPGGEHVLFTAHTLLDNFDDASLQVVSVKTGKTKTVLQGGYFGRYIPSGHLLYLRDGVLYAVGFDLASLETRGGAKPMLDDIAVSTAWGTGRFDFSQSGLFVYRRPVATSWPVVWMDSSGKVKPLLEKPGPYYSPRLSPDGEKLAVSDGGITRGNISVYDLPRDKMIPLTSDGQGHFSPVWTPDGKHLIYRSHYVATGEYAIEWTRVDGSSNPQRLLTSKSSLESYSLSPDGRHLAYMKGETGYDIWTLPIDMSDPEHPKAGDPEPFLISPANELQPVFSPDGDWIAYVSNESRRTRSLYVRPFPTPKDAPDRKWRVSDGNVDFPMWSRKGQELFYLSRPGTIMAISYSTHGDSFVAERPRVWSEQAILQTELFSSLDLSPDSKRFALFPRPDIRDERDAVTRLSVLQNFFDEVRRRVPPGKLSP